MNILRLCFNLCCFSLAFGMTLFWCYKFWLDEDLCIVDYKTFEDSFDVDYPMLSICLNDPFIESRLRHYDSSLTKARYVETLRGNIQLSGLENIDFDIVSRNLSSFILADKIRYQNGTPVNGWYPSLLNGIPELTFSGFVHDDFMMCIGLRSKSRNIKYSMFGFDSNLFPNGIREDRNFSTRLHLPNKFLVSENTYKSSWPERNEKKEYLMAFVLNQIDILKRRSKRNDPCIPETIHFDTEVLHAHLNSVNCRPAYQKIGRNRTICSSRNDLKAAKFESTALSNMKKPCTSAEIITYTYEEYEINKKGPNWVWFVVDYPKKFKEIKMVRAVNIQTVIGNAGGYVGLFLGKIISTSCLELLQENYAINSIASFCFQDLPYYSFQISLETCIRSQMHGLHFHQLKSNKNLRTHGL